MRPRRAGGEVRASSWRRGGLAAILPVACVRFRQTGCDFHRGGSRSGRLNRPVTHVHSRAHAPAVATRARRAETVARSRSADFRPRSRRSALAIVIAAVAPLAAARRKRASRSTLKKPAVKLDEMYRTAEGTRRRGRPTSCRRASPTRSSDRSSPTARRRRGRCRSSRRRRTRTCRSTRSGAGSTAGRSAGTAGRLPDLKPGFVLDGAKLYAIAREHGAKPLADGYFVQIGTAAAPSNRHATWNLQFTKRGREVLGSADHRRRQHRQGRERHSALTPIGQGIARGLLR